MEIKGEEVWESLPENLVENILAMVPFPYVFKARGLSKFWLARFSSISSLGDDKSKELLATSFQKLLSERSNTWKTLCPVFVDDGKAFGYDKASEKWRRMPSLSFLPDSFLNRRNLRMEGPLLYALPLRNTILPDEAQMYVANVLTQTWKHVPPCPDRAFSDGFSDVRCQKLVIDQATGTFKVIRICRPRGVHTYDSKLGSWSSRHDLVFPRNNYINDDAAYLHGILYMVSDDENLVAYNVDKGTSEVLDIQRCKALHLTHVTLRTPAKLVVCNATLMMVYALGIRCKYQLVFKIDLDSREVFHVARGPPASLDKFCGARPEPVSDGSCIFFGMDSENRVLAYNVESTEWSCSSVPPFPNIEGTGRVCNTRSRAKALAAGVRTRYRWSVSSFQPSCIPFLAV